MIIKLITSVFLVLSLAGCVKDNVKDPPPIQDFVVIDPDKTPELRLNTVQWQAWNQKRLSEEAANPINKNTVFFVLTQDQLGALLDNLTSISDVFAKSIENNQYWQKSVDDYRAKKKADIEAAKAQEQQGKGKK